MLSSYLSSNDRLVADDWQVSEEPQDEATQCPWDLTRDTMAVCLLHLYRSKQVLLTALAGGTCADAHQLISCFTVRRLSSVLRKNQGRAWDTGFPQRYHMPETGETEANLRMI